MNMITGSKGFIGLAGESADAGHAVQALAMVDRGSRATLQSWLKDEIDAVNRNAMAFSMGYCQSVWMVLFGQHH
jgi:hypothetical protein